MTQPDVQATLQARFVDDDTLVRTGRALLEVNGHGWVVVPVPAGWAEQIEAVLDAAVEADTISVFVDAAEAAATAASGHAQVAFDEADRSASEADRAEAAAQSAATGVQPDTVGRLHLTPGLRGEIDGKAPVSHDHAIGQVTGLQGELDGKANTSHTHTRSDITDLPEIRSSAVADSLALRSSTGNVLVAGTPSGPSSATSKSYVDTEVGKKADASHTHSQYATTTQVEARTPEIRIVSSPDLATSPGVLYVVMED